MFHGSEQDSTNGCVKEETLSLFEELQGLPHLLSWTMFPYEEENSEIVSVMFQHYVDIITVNFNSETRVGEVVVHNPDSDHNEDVFGIGCITVEKFIELLGKIPHIVNYLEDEGLSETLH